MMGKTLFTEATVEIAVPWHGRLLRRLAGLPSGKLIQVPLVAEALVDSAGEPEIKIEVRDGRAGVVIITDNDERYCFIRRVTLREKGAGGANFKALTRVVRKGVEVRAPYEAPSLKPLNGEELDRAVEAFGRAGTPHTGGVLEGRGPYIVGEQSSESTMRVSGLVSRIAGAIEVEGGRARMPGPITVHGLVAYDFRAAEPGDVMRLATMESEEIAEADRLAACREATQVAKRRAGYAVREKEHRDRAASIAKARNALRAGLADGGRFTA